MYVVARFMMFVCSSTNGQYAFCQNAQTFFASTDLPNSTLGILTARQIHPLCVTYVYVSVLSCLGFVYLWSCLICVNCCWKENMKTNELHMLSKAPHNPAATSTLCAEFTHSVGKMEPKKHHNGATTQKNALMQQWLHAKRLHVVHRLLKMPNSKRLLLHRPPPHPPHGGKCCLLKRSVVVFVTHLRYPSLE